MIIYELLQNTKYQSLIFENSHLDIFSSYELEDKETIRHKIPSFISVKLIERYGYHGIKGKLLKKGDFTTLLYAPVFNDNSKSVLKNYIEPYGEFIELCDNYKKLYYLFHNMNYVDALNISNSKINYFSDGCIDSICSYSFNYENIHNTFIFRLPQDPNTILVDDVFVSVVLENNLKGFVFVPLWDSEGKILPDKIET